MSAAAPLRRSPTHLGRVVEARWLTARMRRVVVRSDSMIGVASRPAQDVELHLVDETGRRVKRRYTIRTARPEIGELDLDVLVHGDGPGSRWGELAERCDEVAFQGPRGKLELRPAQWHLLVGDESALPAIASICEALPDDEPAVAVIETRDHTDELPVRAQLRWVHRGAGAPGTPDHLLAALADVATPAGGAGYLMGETRSMVALRAVLESRGFAHDAVFVKGYWSRRGVRSAATAGEPERRDT